MDRLKEKLSRYVADFNAGDEELYAQFVPNSEAELFLMREIPRMECPDDALEEIYYFRWWTLRKHLKKTEKGFIFTEFLPSVPWSGPYNSINCAACLHLREARWLADPNGYVKQYIQFWLNGDGNAMAYSAWYADALWEYCELRGDFSLGVERLSDLVQLYLRREREQGTASGLLWSSDDRDGMEYSISGPGLRPTLNSYAYGDALAIARFAKIAGDEKTEAEFSQKAAHIKRLVQKLLWNKGFFRTIPAQSPELCSFARRPEVDPSHDARELAGFIPWYFHLPDKEYASAFRALDDPDAFAAPCGLTTAEQSHPRYMESFDHECLWNGPVWPYAVSQTLVALANLLRAGEESPLTKEDYYRLLRQYAVSQHRVRPDGKTVPWIDENLSPKTGRWLSRDILESWGWKPELGGYERGKDYNHSLFCDLILSGLLGISVGTDGKPQANPLIPDQWAYFRVENLTCPGGVYQIVFDRDGSVYHGKAGLQILRQDAQGENPNE